MSKLPVAANKPGRSLWASDRDGRQSHIDPSLFENAGFGSEPSSALPNREQPGCDTDALRRRWRDLRTCEVGCRRQRSDACQQMQKFAAENPHVVLSNCV
jgi:hypothetical protein